MLTLCRYPNRLLRVSCPTADHPFGCSRCNVVVPLCSNGSLSSPALRILRPVCYSDSRPPTSSFSAIRDFDSSPPACANGSALTYAVRLVQSPRKVILVRWRMVRSLCKPGTLNSLIVIGLILRTILDACYFLPLERGLFESNIELRESSQGCELVEGAVQHALLRLLMLQQLPPIAVAFECNVSKELPSRRSKASKHVNLCFGRRAKECVDSVETRQCFLKYLPADKEYTMVLG